VGTYQGGTAAADSGYTIRITDMWNRQYTDVSNDAFTLGASRIAPSSAKRVHDHEIKAKPHVKDTIFKLPDLIVSEAWIENRDGIRWLRWKVENKNWRKAKLDPDILFVVQFCGIGIRCYPLRVSRMHIDNLNRSGYFTIKYAWDYNCDVRFIVDFEDDVEEYNESNNLSTFNLIQ
jgi:hypothetical protein